MLSERVEHGVKQRDRLGGDVTDDPEKGPLLSEGHRYVADG
jgi:hypothetical protein